MSKALYNFTKTNNISVEQLIKALGGIKTEGIIVDNGEKLCYVCNQTKPTLEFHATNRLRTIFRAECKDCFNRIRKEERRKLFFEALSFYSNGTNKCQCCGEARVEFMTFDHPNGRPKDEKLLSSGRRSSVVSILYSTPRDKWPKDLRILCYNCNLSRGVYGYCPHEKERQISTTNELTQVRKEW